MQSCLSSLVAGAFMAALLTWGLQKLGLRSDCALMSAITVSLLAAISVWKEDRRKAGGAAPRRSSVIHEPSGLACYKCGRHIPVGKVRRRTIETGNYHSQVIDGHRIQVPETMDAAFCPSCAGIGCSAALLVVALLPAAALLMRWVRLV